MGQSPLHCLPFLARKRNAFLTVESTVKEPVTIESTAEKIVIINN